MYTVPVEVTQPVEVAEPVEVRCNGLKGMLLPFSPAYESMLGDGHGGQQVQVISKRPRNPPEVVSASEFERRGGRGGSKNWLRSLHVSSGQTLEKYLKAQVWIAFQNNIVAM